MTVALGQAAHGDVSEAVEAWARALCVAYGTNPDQIIGEPKLPRWRSWVSYAELSIKAAASLGLVADGVRP